MLYLGTAIATPDVFGQLASLHFRFPRERGRRLLMGWKNRGRVENVCKLSLALQLIRVSRLAYVQTSPQ